MGPARVRSTFTVLDELLRRALRLGRCAPLVVAPAQQLSDISAAVGQAPRSSRSPGVSAPGTG
ncbi:hypothetical protein AXA44_47265 [Rhodococcus sp. SC4]|nr:hypothetical protein AXA44_47265 [Rhodococcus sp. SC4]